MARNSIESHREPIAPQNSAELLLNRRMRACSGNISAAFNHFRKIYDSLNTTPTEFFEIVLYQATKEFAYLVRSATMDIPLLPAIGLYPAKILASDPNLTEAERMVVVQDKGEAVLFAILRKLLNVAGFLVVRWKLFRTKDFAHRYSTAFDSSAVDRKAICFDVIPPESVWLATVVNMQLIPTSGKTRDLARAVLAEIDQIL
jgi:hypothetical protein